MRFIVMHKVDANMESGGPPSKTIVEEMGRLVGGSMREGIFVDGAGLHRSAKRVRLRYRGGAREVTRGPYAGDDETVAGLAMVKAKSIEDAMTLADRFAKVLGDGEIEIGPVVEGWDIGVMPEPEEKPTPRFLLLRKGDAPPPEALIALEKTLAGEGVLLSAASLAKMSRASRLPPTSGTTKRAWLDGPFAESKELIAGYSILEVASKADAIAWADRYAAILVDSEVDVREIVSLLSP
jgi:hypothetical protein